ncbi:hypothetical protein FLW53_14505 [Microbispora sp. SCL1-1]|nr:hypothetical protein FLW53_14505 [Microbispora sp. SCL1-1]
MVRGRHGGPGQLPVWDDNFRNGTGRWIVAVKMISEGVDIPRLAVGVYASKIQRTASEASVVKRTRAATPTPPPRSRPAPARGKAPSAGPRHVNAPVVSGRGRLCPH